ncbi:MAG: glycosyltransferase family 4 protein [Nanoarchaeota archaeon]|nr:glycosyltransferase family 4 protein [Nanoarchaeota archaeon]
MKPLMSTQANEGPFLGRKMKPFTNRAKRDFEGPFLGRKMKPSKEKNKDKKTILFVAVPLSNPIDKASKNAIMNILSKSSQRFIILCTKEFRLPSNINPKNIILKRIYDKKKNPMSLKQKIRLFFWILTTKEKVDVIHYVFEPSITTGLIFRAISRIKKKKTIQSIQNYQKKSIFNKIKYFGDKIIVSSDLMYNALRGSNLKRSVIIKMNPAVDCGFFSPQKKDSSLVKKLNLKNKKVIFYGGNYQHSLGYKTLRLAVPKILKREPNARLIMACRILYPKERRLEKEFKDAMKKRGVKEQIIFLNTISNLKEMISISDITLYPSIKPRNKSDYPLVLLEAMAMGKPIIISDIPPLNEILRDGGGLRIKPKNPGELIEKTLMLLKDENLAQKLSKEARINILRNHDIKKVYENIDSIYIK